MPVGLQLRLKRKCSQGCRHRGEGRRGWLSSRALEADDTPRICICQAVMKFACISQQLPYMGATRSKAAACHEDQILAEGEGEGRPMSKAVESLSPPGERFRYYEVKLSALRP